MNDAQYVVWFAYLRQLADLMQLKDWDIKLERDRPEDKQAWASVEVCRQHATAWVRVFWPEFFEVRTPEEQRRDVVHELLHCHLDRIHHLVSMLCDIHPEKQAGDFAKEQHRIEVEFVSDDLARVIAPYLPLPPKVK